MNPLKEQLKAEDERLRVELEHAHSVRDVIVSWQLPFVSKVTVEVFHVVGVNVKHPILVVGVNRGLSGEERAMIPPEMQGIRIISEYVEDLPEVTPEIQQEVSATKEMVKKSKEAEDSSSSEDEAGTG